MQNDLYYSNKDPDAIQPLVIPQVRIDYAAGRRRLSSEFTEVSEYDLPLDSKWEFPRERSVRPSACLSVCLPACLSVRVRPAPRLQVGVPPGKVSAMSPRPVC